MKKILLLTLLVAIGKLLFSQIGEEVDNNITISKSIQEFSFVKGDGAHPVQIKEESRKTYLCNNYRTDIPVLEFYNDMVKIEDVNILVNGSKKHGIIPQNEYYSVDGVFYSDARICFFKLPLLKKGSTSEVRFKKTVLDPHYFTKIYFADNLTIADQQVKLIVPAWMQIEIKEYNFENYEIQKDVTTSGDATVYTYSMKNLPGSLNEPSAPGPGYYTPHLLVLCKSAQPGDEEYIYFNTVKNQYNWYRKLVLEIGDDVHAVREKSTEITKNLTSDEEKVKAIFLWVQENIRYIAFEDGIMGFKPEKAQEVLRKKYGDCKGMANLLTVMLKSINLDARRCWIGTKHIPYDYQTPSLAVDNHMICAWMRNGKPVFLDATEKYIGFGEIAERIQNRQTLIENGDDYLLERVPSATYHQNTATEIRKFTMDHEELKGHVVQVWKGENKEWLLSKLNDIKKDKQENALKQYLAGGIKNYEISNLIVTNIDNYNADLKVEYDVLWKKAVTTFGTEAYLGVDNRRYFESSAIDTSKRKLPYWFSFKNNLIQETEVQIPEGKSVETLPGQLTITEPGFSFKAAYQNADNKIRYRNEIILNKTDLNPDEFSNWNRAIKQLNDFYNQQLILNSTK